MRRDNWLFGFAAIGAVAGLTKILEYAGINPFTKPIGAGVMTPSPVPPIPVHDTGALLWGIGLFLFSIGLSIYGFLRKAKRLEIINVWDRDTVTFRQDVIGVVSDPKLTIELRVFAGGVWHRQWPVKIEGSKWRGQCQFGDEGSRSKSGDYRVVAISPKQNLSDKIADLPKDAVTSSIITVHRPAIQPDSTKLNKERDGTLTIHAAEWIPIQRGSARRVERFIQDQIREAVVDSVSFQLKNPNLGGELPGAKDTDKFLKLSYSYGDNVPRELIKDEYEWLILPEPPDGAREDQIRRDRKLLESAPRLLVEYSTDGVKNHLTFINDGDTALYRWNLNPLRCAYNRSLATAYGNPPITAKNRIVQEVIFDGDGSPMFDFIRTKTPPNADTTTAIYYEDEKGHGFIRDFTLKTYANGSLIWEPGEIRLHDGRKKA